MIQATLIKGSNPWKLGNLRGMSFEELDSTLNQVLGEPSCPPRLLLIDTGESYSYTELGDKTIRQLIHNKIGG